MKYDSYSLLLTTYNEEERVGRVIEYYKKFARILVIDNFSTDGTIDIVKKCNIKYVQHKNPGSLQNPEGFRYLASLSDTDYFVLLSCSEFLPAPLFDLFNEIAISKKYDVVRCPADDYTCGELIPVWGRYKARNDSGIERFFNKLFLDYDSLVIHGSIPVLDKKKILYLPREKKYLIVHLRDSDTYSLISKHLDYAKVEAQQLVSSGKSFGILTLIWLFLVECKRFLRIPLKQWNIVSIREIWARMVMHSIIYFISWELETGWNLSKSQDASKKRWETLLKKKDSTYKSVK